ncbi:peptidoglycan DD-metalloendopeptidase family protein [soil metagenome]
MNKNVNLFAKMTFAGVVASVISACSTAPNNAPIVDRTTGGSSEASRGVTPAAMVVKSVVDPKASYVVKRGDTLFRIALDHGQSYSDIVTWNNLKNPNDIKVDQVLRVISPESGTNGGVQTASVSSGSSVEVRSLSSVNPSTNKSVPRGDKRPYTDANLTDLQKVEPSASPASVVVAKSEIVSVKPQEKPVVQIAAESDAVDWIWPTEGRVVAGFDDAKNKGLDITGKLGQDVLAAGAGKVMYEGSGIRGYGNLVIIKHTNNLLSAYAHNKVNLVKEGQAISRGQKIAEMGNSDSDGVKLHFEIRQQGKPVDPSKFLPGR